MNDERMCPLAQYNRQALRVDMEDWREVKRIVGTATSQYVVKPKSTA